MQYTATLVKTIPIQISFVHPLRDGDNNAKRIKRSTKLYDWKQALSVKAEIDSILSTPARWTNIGDVSETAKALWTLEPSVKPSLRRPVFHDGLGSPIGWNSQDEIIAQNQMQILRDALKQKEARIAELEALLRAAAKDATAEFTAYVIETAIADFVSTDIAVRGTKELSERVRNRYRLWLLRFARNGHAGRDCNLISSAEVVAYLSTVHSGKHNGGVVPLPRSTRKEAENLLAFMKYATKGRFKPFEVEAWMTRTEH